MRTEYERRLAARAESRQRHEAAFRRIANLRLVVVVAGAALAWWNFWTLPLPVSAFIALIIWHEQVSRKADRETRSMRFYETAIARIEGQWPGLGSGGERFRDPAHPYADDLDLFGRGSLFQLMSGARTHIGEDTLAAWLKSPADAETVRQRHAAIDDLRPRLDLRENLALVGEEVETSIHAEKLAAWGEAPPARLTGAHRIAAFLLSVLMVAVFSGYMFELWRLAWVAAVALAEMIFFLLVRPRVEGVLEAVEAPARELDVLARVGALFEREVFQSARLLRVQDELGAGRGAAREIARLERLIEYREWDCNKFFAPVGKPLLWTPQFAMAIEVWRRRNGPHIRAWLAAIGELEALCSIAGYAAEHPDDVFAEIADAATLFDGTGIAHPLLTEEKAVRNDVRLDSATQMFVVSGSNMSGKSTLLRAVGLNVVLAWAGAPVRARRLRLSPLAIGASMRPLDSVLEGKSRFYAEITRIRQIVDMAGGAPPLLFLLDEVLSGTNSHDRRIGAEAIIRTLIDAGAIGLITTHDLALARIAESLAPRAMNVHFEDHLEDGIIAFDYRMRPGVVTKSNAVELMRSVGLKV